MFDSNDLLLASGSFFILRIGEVPVVAILAFIASQGIDGQTVLEFDETRRSFGSLFVRVANLVFVADPAFFGFVW